jgi:transposase
VALLATLSAVTSDTRRQLNWLVGEVLGAPSSVGTVQKHLEEASKALEPGFWQADEAVNESAKVGIDETGWRKGSLPYWIWGRQTDEVAIYDIRQNRTKAVAQELIEEPGERVFVTDRYGAYSFLPVEQHQICHAHLLREFRRMSERDGPVGRIGKKLCDLTGRFLSEFARVRSGELARDGCVDWINKEVRPEWKRLLKKAAEYGKKAPAVVRWLRKKENVGMAWVFLEHPGLEPTNNASERALRGPVIQRKISWGSQSDEGLRLMERLWTTAETCKRQCRSVLDYITQAVEAFRRGAPAPMLIKR